LFVTFICYNADVICILFNQYLPFEVQDEDKVNNLSVIKTVTILLGGWGVIYTSCSC